LAHSIPEAQSLVIRTPAGVVLHTGDWKLDPEPLIGPRTDEAAFAALGDQGVLAMVCDSTNAMVEGHSGSEADVRRSLSALVRSLRGRVAVTCFASNVARIESVALAARDARRSVAVAGRSLRNLEAAARDCGYLKGIAPFLGEDEANDISDDRLLLLVGGSQGEPRSALSRIALDTHPRIELGEGDTVVFSSRMIPGNERAIGTVQDNLVRRGVQVMTDADHMIHVSGHPARDELRKLYKLVRPSVSVPVHGEWRHLSAHAALAQEAGVTPILMEDGDILSLAPGRPEVVDSAPVGRLVLDGARLVPLKGAVMGARRRMLFNGVAIASLAVDEAGRLRGMPRLSAPGLFEADDPENANITRELAEAIAELPAPLRCEDAALIDAARAALRRSLGRRLGKRPLVDVHLLRV
jgi:ribonuclease J